MATKTLDDYDQEIAFWHDEYVGKLELHEYLGLTWDSYSLLVHPN